MPLEPAVEARAIVVLVHRTGDDALGGRLVFCTQLTILVGVA